MADLFRDYEKQNRSKKTFAIMTASLVLAVSINGFLFGTDTGARLQTSVMNSGGNVVSEERAQVELVSSGTGTDMLKIQTNEDMHNVSRAFFSVIFDPETVEIGDIISENKDLEITKSSNVPGVVSVFLKYNKVTQLSANSSLATIVYKKKKADKAVVNIAEFQFKSSDNSTFSLTSKGMEF